jgi:hypothetical protein
MSGVSMPSSIESKVGSNPRELFQPIDRRLACALAVQSLPQILVSNFSTSIFDNFTLHLATNSPFPRIASVTIELDYAGGVVNGVMQRRGDG